MRIEDSKPYLEVGQRVKTNGGGSIEMQSLEGEIGEIQERFFVVFHNDGTKIGSAGKIRPFSKGYAHGWTINFTTSKDREIQILTHPGNPGKGSVEMPKDKGIYDVIVMDTSKDEVVLDERIIGPATEDDAKEEICIVYGYKLKDVKPENRTFVIHEFGRYHSTKQSAEAEEE